MAITAPRRTTPIVSAVSDGNHASRALEGDIMMKIDRLVTVLGLAALALAFALGVSPHAITAQETPAVSAIDTLALTNNAGPLPEQHFPAH
jgi:hypothetical protein